MALILGTVVVAIVAVAGLVGGGDDGGGNDSTEETSSGPGSTAQGLAVLDAGAYVAPDDFSVADYQSALDALSSSVCTIPEERIADMAVESRRQLAESGVFMDHLDVLSGALREPAPPARAGSAEDRCALVFTSFIIDRT